MPGFPTHCKTHHFYDVDGYPCPGCEELNKRMKWQPKSHWEDHPDHPVEDWRYEVANNDTRLGYLDWVNNRIE